MEVGFVKSVKGFLLEIDGLPKVRVNDVLESNRGSRAFVFSLGTTSVQALLISEKRVEIGEEFKKVSYDLSVPVGEELLGRVISPMGKFLDGKGQVSIQARMPLEHRALGISSRRFIAEQLVSGISVVDTLIPLGKGQRELVVGDARSGKTSFLLDLIVNLKNTEMICVFASIGRPTAKLWNFIQLLAENKATDRLVTVATFPSDPTPLVFLTPKAAMAVAEYFREKGKDVLIIMDDMGFHAKIYREISLLMGRFPGREGYPGDIFYQHSSLVERAGCFSKQVGGGTITAIPVIEINLDDFTGYIPTNLMSMTDGHLLFNSALISQGKRPGVDISLSVSRVGRQTQPRIMSDLSLKIRQVFSQSAQFENIAGFGGELPAATRQILHQKDLLEECLKQGIFQFLNLSEQCMLLSLPFMKSIQDVSLENFANQKMTFCAALKADPELVGITKKVLTLPKFSELISEMEKTNPILGKIFNMGDQDKGLVDPETWKPGI